MLSLGGCLLSGDKPEPGLVIPRAYDGGPKNPALAEAAVPTLDWWRGFRSKELTEVIEEARAANLDIAAAVARIVQADAQARVAGAPLLPNVVLNGSATRLRTSQSTSAGGTTGSLGGSERDLLSTSLTASYEIDFWGKNRSAQRAAEEFAVASRYDREVVGLTTVVATANAYFQVLAAQDRLRVAQENLASANRVLNLIQQRLNAGTASALDVAQQQSLVSTQRAAIPPLQQTLQQNRNALAVLIARSPERVRIRGGSLRAIATPRVTPGLPSELLAQRPDIRQAEANLAAANANVENARAQFLPSITLTGEGGYQPARSCARCYGRKSAILYRGRRLNPADLRRRPHPGQFRPAERQAGRALADLSQGGDLSLLRRGDRARSPSARPHCAMTAATRRGDDVRGAPSKFPSSA